jgi:hypothetical protein
MEGSMSFPVTLDVERPQKFDRLQVVLRLALLVVVGWIGHPVGLLWLGLPLVAGVLVSQKGGQRYLDGRDGVDQLLHSNVQIPTGFLASLIGFSG